MSSTTAISHHLVSFGSDFFCGLPRSLDVFSLQFLLQDLEQQVRAWKDALAKQMWIVRLREQQLTGILHPALDDVAAQGIIATWLVLPA